MTTKTRSPTRLSGVTAMIANGIWAIKGDQLRDIVTGFNAYLQGRIADADALQELRAARDTRAAATQDAQDQAPTVALISLHGTIFPRGSLMVDYCGAVDAHTFAARVQAAAADPSVRSIILDIDSGGGAVAGTDVAARAVADASTVKTVTAVANTMACSAAYWIASQATEVIVTPAGEVGSIGVIGTHTDQTAALEGEGLKVTYVRSTERKALGQSGEAMEGPVLEQWQKEMTAIHELFVQAIATGRDIPLARASSWATGDVWFGEAAVTAGLADRVALLSDIVAEHQQATLPPPAAPALRQGRHADAPPTPQEDPVKLTIQDRTGKTHTLDTTADAAPTHAQTLASTLESGAYEAGIQSQRELTATALGVDVNDLTAERLAQIRAQAADGNQYRADLLSQIERLATTVHGAENATAIDRAKRLASKADTADLPGMIDDLTAQRNAKIPAGRQSLPDAGASAKDPTEPDAPDTPAQGTEAWVDPALYR
ncbi:S49 family peptidase [Deinococcus sp. 6GRE01]|uniref:S49 family peptidase n=1 Tax=Deinococcus sp. 6GRE01 TaxID=2745873 RepID=UPI001E474001|nr:S49 family peptidase [Deinococcus sp. 6GRE01]MCD0156276.1 S49 family peptidase [Deinococcus sp. 6GRE01]